MGGGLWDVGLIYELTIYYLLFIYDLVIYGL